MIASRITLGLLGLALFGSCVGTENVLFYTKSGVAIDADSTPPTMNLGYIREEKTIAPLFEGNQVLPVMTTIGARAGQSRFSADHSFATGDAAMILADAFLQERRYPLSDPVGLNNPDTVLRPRMDGRVLIHNVDKSGDDDRSIFFFGTDTNLGLSVEWDKAYPSAVSLGYKRKELAVVPLKNEDVWLHRPSGRVFTPSEYQQLVTDGRRLDESGKLLPGGETAEGNLLCELKQERKLALVRSVRVSSLIATAGAGATVKGPDETEITVSSAFATGPAATLLATHAGIRKVLGPILAPGGEAAAKNLLAEGGVWNISFLNDLYVLLSEQVETGDSDAETVLSQLNELAGKREEFRFDVYSYDPDSKTLKFSQDTHTVKANFNESFQPFWHALNESIEGLNNALVERKPGVTLKKIPNPPEPPQEDKTIDLSNPEDVAHIRLVDELAEMRKQRARYQELYAEDPRLVAAFDYFVTWVRRKN